jgi:hypothetical protein
VTTCNTTGGATIMGSFPHPRNGVIKIDYEFILIFKKPGAPPWNNYKNCKLWPNTRQPEDSWVTRYDATVPDVSSGAAVATQAMRSGAGSIRDAAGPD